MLFNQVLFAAVFAVAASAQNDTAPTDAQKECYAKCDSGDVVCLAHCPGFVPSPTEEDIAKLNDCSVACEQGDGSPAATDAYGKCLADCAEKYYFASGVGTPNQGFGGSSDSSSGSGSGSGGSGSGSGDDSKDGGDSDSKSDGGNSTDSSNSEGDKGNSAATLVASSLVGFVAAMLAL